jgi:hypothetical protein
VLDGVYRCGADGAPTFIETAASTDQELHALLQTVIARFMKMLTRRGVLVEEMGQTWLADCGSLATTSPSASSRPISRSSERPQRGAERPFGARSQQTAIAAQLSFAYARVRLGTKTDRG